MRVNRPVVWFLVTALVLFLGLAAIGSAVTPPDPYSTLPVVIVAFVVPWPIAYWLVYRGGFSRLRGGTTA